jgi:hypothetical protein
MPHFCSKRDDIPGIGLVGKLIVLQSHYKLRFHHNVTPERSSEPGTIVKRHFNWNRWSRLTSSKTSIDGFIRKPQCHLILQPHRTIITAGQTSQRPIQPS